MFLQRMHIEDKYSNDKECEYGLHASKVTQLNNNSKN